MQIAIGIQVGSQQKISNIVVYELGIGDCPGNGEIVYSLSPVFQPGIYVYTNAALTIPFISEGYWTATGAENYPIDSNGLVLNEPYTCP